MFNFFEFKSKLPSRTASRSSVFGIVTRQRASRSGFRIPVGIRDFLSSRRSREVLGRTQPLIQQGPWFCHGSKGSGVNLVTQLYLVMRLRIRGVILLLPLYTFMSWTGKNFTFLCQWRVDQPRGLVVGVSD